MTRIPAMHFDSTGLPPADAFANWSAAITQYETSHPPGADPASFRVVVDAWLVGDLAVSATQVSPMRLVRHAEQARADGIDQFSFFMLRKGHWTGQVGEKALTAGPGQIVMFDLAQPFDVVSAADMDTHSIAVQIARAPIVAAAPGVDLHGFMLQGPVGRILADHLMMLARRLPHTEAEEAADIARDTAALIASCLASAPESRDAAPAREIETRHRVFRYLDQNLGRPDLTANRLCKDLGLSRSSLYRAFAPLGGLADTVRARRLEAAHARLEDPALDGKISDIAGAFGFVSDAHFSRVFRQRYGYNPRRARNGDANALREMAAIVGARNAPDIFQAWLKQIG